MSNFWGKALSSRFVRTQVLNYAGNATAVGSVAVGPQILQIRIVSQVPGYLAIGDSSVSASTSVDALISANVAPEFITVTNGQFVSFNSTSTTTGRISITELA